MCRGRRFAFKHLPMQNSGLNQNFQVYDFCGVGKIGSLVDKSILVATYLRFQVTSAVSGFH